MRKITFTLLLICVCSFAFAQSPFAVIEDADGYTNLRDANKNIVGKIYEDDVCIFSYFDESIGDYDFVDEIWRMPNTFTRFGDKEADRDPLNVKSYIHKSRVKLLSDLPQLKKIEVDEHKAIFYDKETTIEIITGGIDQKVRNIEFDPGGHGFAISIDGYKTHGIDWPLSERDTEVKSINYVINGVASHFEAKHIRGFLNLSGEYLSIAKGKNKMLYIYGNGGDGSGGYSIYGR